MGIEVEVHESNEGLGKFTGIQTAVLAILLAIFTILAHRGHTDTIVIGNKASSGWAHYQAKRIRAYQIEMNTQLISLTAPKTAETSKVLEEYSKDSEKYKKELEGIKEETEIQEKAEEKAHHQASVFDLAEGFLEIGMILSSLYFLTKKNFFPVLGFLLGSAGIVMGVMGLLIH